MNYAKRILSIFLILCVLASLSTAVFAGESDEMPPVDAVAEEPAPETPAPADEEAPSAEALPDEGAEPEESTLPEETGGEEPTDAEETPPSSEIAAEESASDAPIEAETPESTTGTEESTAPTESSEPVAEDEEAPAEEPVDEEPPEPEESVAENGAEAKATGVPIIHGKGVRVNGTLTIGYYSYLDGAYRTAYIQAIEQKTINGAVVYCLAPEMGSEGKNYTMVEQSAAWLKIPSDKRRAIGLAMGYGYPNQNYSASANDIYWYGKQAVLNTENYIATQLIIWEILAGVRSSQAPYALKGSTSYRNAFDSGWNTIRTTYDAIVAKMANHAQIPAYANNSKGAYVYELKYNSSTGTYRYMLPAERQSDWRECRMTLPDGISYLKAADGQTVVGFEATVEAAMALPAEGYTVTGQSPYLSVSPDTAVVCWTCTGSQTVAAMPAGADPARAYFTLKADVTGSMTARKTSPSGDVEGYCFKIYHWGDSYKDNYTDALGHHFVDEIVAPTSTEKGYTKHTCDRCWYSYNDTYTNPVKVIYDIEQAMAIGNARAAELGFHVDYSLTPDHAAYYPPMDVSGAILGELGGQAWLNGEILAAVEATASHLGDRISSCSGRAYITYDEATDIYDIYFLY